MIFLPLGLGEGPYILASSGENDTIIGANVSSRRIFPLPRTGAYGNVFFSFMITPGLFKDKDLCKCSQHYCECQYVFFKLYECFLLHLLNLK